MWGSASPNLLRSMVSSWLGSQHSTGPPLLVRRIPAGAVRFGWGQGLRSLGRNGSMCWGGLSRDAAGETNHMSPGCNSQDPELKANGFSEVSLSRCRYSEVPCTPFLWLEGRQA